MQRCSGAAVCSGMKQAETKSAGICPQWRLSGRRRTNSRLVDPAIDQGTESDNGGWGEIWSVDSGEFSEDDKMKKMI